MQSRAKRSSRRNINPEQTAKPGSLRVIPSGFKTRNSTFAPLCKKNFSFLRQKNIFHRQASDAGPTFLLRPRFPEPQTSLLTAPTGA